MIEILHYNYRKARSIYQKLQFYYTVNWTKTLYFNFKKISFWVLLNNYLFFFYGSVKFTSIKEKFKSLEK
jgi:hypothetical protein